MATADFLGGCGAQPGVARGGSRTSQGGRQRLSNRTRDRGAKSGLEQPLGDFVTRAPAKGPNGGTTTVLLNECGAARYPDEAYIAHLTGTSLVDFTVDAQGLPTNLRARNHLGLGLDELAQESVSECRFQPARKDGHAIAVDAMRTVAFSGRPGADSPWHLAEAVFHLKSGDSRPVFLKAGYPASAGRAGGQKITIAVQLTIDSNGVPQDIQASGAADTKWARQAAAIVSKWRFTPGLRDGQPAPIPATFRLVCQP